MTSEIRTERLILRWFQPTDAEVFAALAGDRAISDTMISVPHPLPAGFALGWVTAGAPNRFAVCEVASGLLAGAIELRELDYEHCAAELSFWIGRPFWRRGYASEAGLAVIHHAFVTLGLNRVYAFHMVRNPASGQVLAKLGMRQEGLLRQKVRKWGRFEDVVARAVLREDLGYGALPTPVAPELVSHRAGS
ncbi:MAG: GNAT family N-acetyltransferase [Chromatiaceae bacterium]|nr:GNAT family N-acetyltransferase [Chromatiaceae bacterium]